MPLDLIIFAAIALFFIIRLGSTLGKRTGHQKPTQFPGTTNAPEPDQGSSHDNDDNVVRLPTDFEPPEEESTAFKGPAGEALRDISDADANFEPDGFLQGATAAFEMIVNAYAEGDRKTLKQLLDKPTYESFSGAIDAREEAGHRMEDTLVGVDSASISSAVMEGDVASVTVRFVSQQVNVTYDSEGRVVDGDPTTVETVSDIWTFARTVTSGDPNWELVETSVDS